MGVLVSIGRQKAILRRGEWVSADPSLERRLNEASAAWIRDTGGPPLDAADPEHSLATEITRQLGGRIVIRAAPNARAARGLYLGRRQLQLDFGDPS